MILPEQKLRNIIKSVIYKSLLKEDTATKQLDFKQTILNITNPIKSKDIDNLNNDDANKFFSNIKLNLMNISMSNDDILKFINNLNNTQKGMYIGEDKLYKLYELYKNDNRINQNDKVDNQLYLYLYDEEIKTFQLSQDALEANQALLESNNQNIFKNNIIAILEACKEKNKIWDISIIDKEINIIKELKYNQIDELIKIYGSENANIRKRAIEEFKKSSNIGNINPFRKNWCAEILFSNLEGTNSIHKINPGEYIPISELFKNDISNNKNTIDEIVKRLVNTVFYRHKQYQKQQQKANINKQNQDTNIKQTGDVVNIDKDINTKPNKTIKMPAAIERPVNPSKIKKSN